MCETSETKQELPTQMERHFHRDDYKNGSLTITFTNAAHLADARNYARKIGKLEEFDKAIIGLIVMAMGAAIPQPDEALTDGTPVRGYAGKDHNIRVYPDSHTQPSFGWQEGRGMVGGLIWHRSSGEWQIHT